MSHRCRRPNQFYWLFVAMCGALFHSGAANAATGTWWQNGQPTMQAYAALDLIQSAPQHGLPRSRYAYSHLITIALTTHDPSAGSAFAELLNAALFDLARDLQPGKENDSAVELKRAIEADELDTYFATLTPTHDDYRGLQSALRRYEDFAATGGWPKVTSGPTLELNTSGPRIAELRARLAVTDPTLPPTLNPQYFDSALEAAVRRFQKRHGLAVDGQVGPRTLAALNLTAASKVRSIALNLHRWRALPTQLPQDRIVVNIPAFDLQFYRKNDERLQMRVVVGAKKTPTPTIIDAMEHLVFNPFWYLPQSIAGNEILPRLQRDPGYLQRARLDVLSSDGTPISASGLNWKNFEAGNLPYRFRQQPGPRNAMGSLKFIFPNNYAVYMHDTPARSQFARATRAYSHGCVRLEDPAALALAVLEHDQDWAQSDVQNALDSGIPKVLRLQEDLPVLLVYLTASERDGAVHFHNDIYEHDSPAEVDRHSGRALLTAAVLDDLRARDSALQIASR